MNGIVHCCLYGAVFFAVHWCQDIADNEGYSNYLPFVVEPKIENMRIKIGTPIKLKCDHRGIWEYKHCDTNYKGVLCNTQDLTNIKSADDSWVRLPTKYKLEISSPKKNHSGIYRCIDRDTVKKVIKLEVVGTGSYAGLPPSMAPLKISNITSQLNMEFTIQCNVSSVVPPTIIWFKRCFGLKCDINHDNICYCHLNLNTSVYNLANTYLSKVNIFNARDVDSGLYACLAVTEYGKDYKNVTIDVPRVGTKGNNNSSFSWLFLIPLNFVFIPVLVWLCYFRRKKKAKRATIDQRKKLINSPPNTSLNAREQIV